MNVLILSLVLLFSGDGFPEGMRAYKEGRFNEAFEVFSAMEEKAGADAAPELLYNKALAALKIKDLLAAESAMEKAVARGGDDFRPLRDFVNGNTAYLRGLHAEEVASQPEAEPFAYDVAIRFITKAQTFWIQAAMSRPDWPEARRNVERAQMKLAALQKTKKEKQKNLRSHTQIKMRPQLVPQVLADDSQGEAQDEEAKVDAQKRKLSSSQIKDLYDKLEAKEKEKREMRRQQQKQRKTKGERDW